VLWNMHKTYTEASHPSLPQSKRMMVGATSPSHQQRG